MKYFDKKDVLLIKSGIESFAKSFHQDTTCNVDQYFSAYYKTLKKSEEFARYSHFENIDYDLNSWEKTTKWDKLVVRTFVFGRYAYVIGRLEKEGKNCKFDDFGYLEVDGKRIAKPEEYKFEDEIEAELDGFEEDTQVLPSIDEMY